MHLRLLDGLLFIACRVVLGQGFVELKDVLVEGHFLFELDRHDKGIFPHLVFD